MIKLSGCSPVYNQNLYLGRNFLRIIYHHVQTRSIQIRPLHLQITLKRQRLHIRQMHQENLHYSKSNKSNIINEKIIVDKLGRLTHMISFPHRHPQRREDHGNFEYEVESIFVCG